MTLFSQVIAIDGPSGSGKSTIARKLATAFNILYIDTGAMFRAIAYVADQRNLDLNNEDEVKGYLNSIDLEYNPSTDSFIRIDKCDLTMKIREHHVSKLASIISQVSLVREFLLDFQRSLAKSMVCVMEGRDISTVVFPNAFIKFFITATVEVRAQRRLKELLENGEKNINIDDLIKDLKERDSQDMLREVAPLKKCADAIEIDSGNISIDEIIRKMMLLIKEKSKLSGLSL